MKALLCLACLLLSGASALAGSDSLSRTRLLRALDAAFRGELSDGKLIEFLNREIEKGTDPEQRLEAAYLMTFADGRKAPLETLVELLYSSPLTGKLLGDEAMRRVLRLHADRAFEMGKLDTALSDYRRLRAQSPDPIRGYALLKEGWCLLNLGKPESAFALWTDELERAKRNEPGSLLFHGVGHAVVESRDLPASETSRLAALPLTEDDQSSLLQGMEEGIELIESTARENIVIHRLASLPVYEALVARRFEHKPSGKEACALQPWLEAVGGGSLAYGRFGDVTRECVAWLASSEPRGPERARAESALTAVLPRFALKDEERRMRFAFYHQTRRGYEACAEGMDWLLELPAGARLTFPAKSIAEDCRSALAGTAGKARAKVIATLSALASHGKLRDPQAADAYLSALLVDQPGMRAALTNELAEHPDLYRPSLLPRMVAESAMKTAAPEVSPLYEQYADLSQPGTVWFQVLRWKAGQALSGGRLEEAHRLLKQGYGLTPPAPRKQTPESTRLWTAYLVAKTKQGAATGEALTEIVSLLGLPEAWAAPERHQSLIFLGVKSAAWEPLWEACRKVTLELPRKEKDAFLLALFDAIGTGAFTPSSEARDPEIRYVSQLAELVDSPASEALALKPAGKSALATDATWMRGLDADVQKSLKRTRHGDIFVRLQTWIGFLGSRSRRLKGHVYAHPAFLRWSREVLEVYCKTTSERLRATAAPGGTTEEAWRQMVTPMAARLEACGDEPGKGGA